MSGRTVSLLITVAVAGSLIGLAVILSCKSATSPTVNADSVVTHRFPGDWELTLPGGKKACTAQNQSRSFTEDDFLLACRVLLTP